MTGRRTASSGDARARADEHWMDQALALARRGEGRTRPNPPVGAVIVRDGRAIGQGFHRRAGGAHAEIEALRSATADPRGATIYVTLEPCCSQGRTGPCTTAIREAGLARVVVGTRDPNPRHHGRGLSQLRRAGMAVTEGIREDRARDLIAPFAKHITSGRPYVTLKLGCTLDGRIADAQGTSKWITGPAARAMVQVWRRHADAILIGGATARTDDPSLLCQWELPGRLYRVVVDAGGNLDARLRVLSDEAAAQTIVALTRRCPATRRARLERSAGAVWVLPEVRGRVSLDALMDRLGAMGLLHVFCEGGGELAAGLLRRRLVDECVFFLAPRLLGGDGVPAVGAAGWNLAEAPRLCFEHIARVGDDLLVRAKPI